MGIEFSVVSALKPCFVKNEQPAKTKLQNVGLESDVFEKSTNKIKEQIKVFNGSDVSNHHEINGMNPTIRSYLENPNTKRGSEYIKEYIEQTDKEFEKLPPLENNCTVWRGRTENPIIKRFNKDFEIIENAKEGDIIVPDKAYSYTAMDKSLAEHWGGGYSSYTNLSGEPLKQIMYEINIPKGAKVSRNLEHGGEVVMPRGAQYKVLSKSTDKFNCTHVKLEYILPNK